MSLELAADDLPEPGTGHVCSDGVSDADTLPDEAPSPASSGLSSSRSASSGSLDASNGSTAPSSPGPRAWRGGGGEGAGGGGAPQPHVEPKRIAIVVGGTRGDVQPALALALQLAALGHRVRLAADARFAPFVAQHAAAASAPPLLSFPAAAAPAGPADDTASEDSQADWAAAEADPLPLEFFPLEGDAAAMMQQTIEWGGMLPTSLSGMGWLRGQIERLAGSVWDALTLPAPAVSKAAKAGGGAATGVWSPADASGGAGGGAASGASTPLASGGGSSAGGACRLPPDGGADSPFTAEAGSGRAGGACAAAAGGAFAPDLVIANQLAYGAVHCAEALGVPLHVIYTVPWLPTVELPHPWARAWGAGITDWVRPATTLVARALTAPLLPFAGRGARDAAAAALAAASEARANWASSVMLEHIAWSGVADIMLRLRRRLGLPLLSRNAFGGALGGLPTTCLWSEAILPKPSDWGPHIQVAGFLHLEQSVQRARLLRNLRLGAAAAAAAAGGGDGGDRSDEDGAGGPRAAAAGACDWRPPRHLEEFLERPGEEAPVYVGLGSCVLGGAPAAACVVALVSRAARAAGVRAVLALGWAGGGAGGGGGGGGSTPSAAEAGGGAGLDASELAGSLGDHVCLIEEAPHAYVFPRCLALVHHGGVGTMAAGLLVARPTLVVPSFGDLFMWGDLCHRLGVGPPPLPLDRLDESSLATGLRDLAAGARPGGSYAAAAQEVSRGLAREDGLAAAVASVLRDA